MKTAILMSALLLSFGAQATVNADLTFSGMDSKTAKLEIYRSSSVNELKKLITPVSAMKTSAMILQKETRTNQYLQCEQEMIVLYGKSAEVETIIRDQKKFFRGTTIIAAELNSSIFGLSRDKEVKMIQLTDCFGLAK